MRPTLDISFWPPNFALEAGWSRRAAFSLTLFGKLYICQSVTESVSPCHFRAAVAISLFPKPARVSVSSPDMKWDWKENKRRRSILNWEGEERGPTSVGGGWERGAWGIRQGGIGRAQSFLINFDPTEGTDGVTAERETHTRFGMLIGGSLPTSPPMWISLSQCSPLFPRNETDCKNISNVQIVAGGILLLSFISYSTIGIETLTSMLVTSHPVYVEPAALAIGLLQLALESCESGRVCCFCPVGERPALVIHHWVATEDILIWVNRA